MEGNLFTIFATMVNFIILIVVLKYLLFSKISNAINDRHNETMEKMNIAEDYKTQAQGLKESFEKQLAGLEAQGRDIVKEARVKADVQAKDIIKEAETKASVLLSQTDAEVERRKRKALEDMRQEIAELAILAAEKILEKNLDHQAQQMVIGQIIDQAGNEQWQN